MIIYILATYYWHRPLINEHSRIKELYKLSDDMIMQAMVGALANIPEWQAST